MGLYGGGSWQHARRSPCAISWQYARWSPCASSWRVSNTRVGAVPSMRLSRPHRGLPLRIGLGRTGGEQAWYGSATASKVLDHRFTTALDTGPALATPLHTSTGHGTCVGNSRAAVAVRGMCQSSVPVATRTNRSSAAGGTTPDTACLSLTTKGDVPAVVWLLARTGDARMAINAMPVAQLFRMRAMVLR